MRRSLTWTLVLLGPAFVANAQSHNGTVPADNAPNFQQLFGIQGTELNARQIVGERLVKMARDACGEVEMSQEISRQQLGPAIVATITNRKDKKISELRQGLAVAKTRGFDNFATDFPFIDGFLAEYDQHMEIICK